MRVVSRADVVYSSSTLYTNRINFTARSFVTCQLTPCWASAGLPGRLWVHNKPHLLITDISELPVMLVNTYRLLPTHSFRLRIKSSLSIQHSGNPCRGNYRAAWGQCKQKGASGWWWWCSDVPVQPFLWRASREKWNEDTEQPFHSIFEAPEYDTKMDFVSVAIHRRAEQLFWVSGVRRLFPPIIHCAFDYKSILLFDGKYYYHHLNTNVATAIFKAS